MPPDDDEMEQFKRELRKGDPKEGAALFERFGVGVGAVLGMVVGALIGDGEAMAGGALTGVVLATLARYVLYPTGGD